MMLAVQCLISRCTIKSEADIHKSVTHLIFYKQAFFQTVLLILLSQQMVEQTLSLLSFT